MPKPKNTTPPPPPPPRRGRPPKPVGERAVMVSTKVPPAVRDYLVTLGDGRLTAGLRLVAVQAFDGRVQG